MSRLRILVADDHPLVRQGLRKVLEEVPNWEVVGEAGNGRDAVRMAVELRPDVAIVDIGMPQLNGIEATSQMCRRLSGLHVLILSMHSDDAFVVQAMQAGARGYLLKESADADVVRAVAAISEGKSFFSPEVARILVDEYVRHLGERHDDHEPRSSGDRYDSLSEREREIFQLIAEGHPNKEIADILHLSANTVETHRAHILEKLGLHSAAEVVLYAVRRGVVR